MKYNKLYICFNTKIMNHMGNRRNFIKKMSTLAIVGLAGKISANTVTKSVQSTKVNQPIVLSTWNFGIEANKEAWSILQNKGTALDAVEQGVRLVEADPTERSVGYGGRPDRDGNVTLDACIMDHESNIGSVAGLEYIKHPITVARKVMEETPHVMLVGDGALQFALEKGFKKENLLTKESEEEYKEWLKNTNYQMPINIENHDTIGMIALDQNGNLSLRFPILLTVYENGRFD